MASATVSAGSVVGAIVQVLVTKQAAPSFFANTIPRFRAGSVHATGMPLALITELAHPARMTTEI